MKKRILTLLTLVYLLLHVARADAPTGRTLRVYFIGNSVTDTIRYKPLADLAATRDVKIAWGRHMIPGAPLEWLHGHSNDGFREKPYGSLDRTLAPLIQRIAGDVAAP